VGQRTGWVCRWRCARCLGWGSCPTTSPPRRRWPQRETYDRLAHEFTEQRCAGLDGLLVVDPAIGMTRLRWLTTGPVEACPAGITAEVVKLEFLRGLGADTLDLSVLPAER